MAWARQTFVFAWLASAYLELIPAKGAAGVARVSDPLSAKAKRVRDPRYSSRSGPARIGS